MAVKAASRSELAECAIAAARNAQALIEDADLLAGSGRRNGRAYALAVLAVEESSKSVSLAVLSSLPDSFLQQAPLRRMLEWHQMKLVGGLLLTVLPFGNMASRLAAMPPAELARTVAALVPAVESDRLKRRGLYVDMEAGGRTREPTEITATEVDGQLAQARQAAASVAGVVLGPGFPTWLADPPPDGAELSWDLVAALAEAKDAARSPEAATDVILQAIKKFRDRRDSA